MHLTKNIHPTLWATIVIASVLWLGGGPLPRSAAQSADSAPKAADSDSRAIVKIPAGTLVGPRPPEGWSELIFVSTPTVTSGDVNEIATSVLRYAQMLHFVILADLDSRQVDGATRYQLRRVGFGFAVAKSGSLIVASGPRVAGLEPPEFGPIEGQVVSGAEQSLDAMEVLARRTTLMLVDSPAVFHQEGQNRQRIMRTLIWVDPATGRVGHLLWLLQQSPAQPPRLALDRAVYLPTPYHEKREMHVDADEFNFLGLPGPSAFALVQLPPGRAIPLNDSLAKAASREEYTTEQLADLVSQLTSALRGNASGNRASQ